MPATVTLSEETVHCLAPDNSAVQAARDWFAEPVQRTKCVPRRHLVVSFVPG